MVAFAGVAVLGVLWGVGIAIALALLNFIRRAWYPHDAVLGRVEQPQGLPRHRALPDARLIPGLVLYRFDAPLFFANADYFRERVRALAAADDVRWIVVAAEPITDIDATAGETLARAQRRARRRRRRAGVRRAQGPGARPAAPLRHRAAIGAERFFPTLGVAVAAYLAETGVDWTDWEIADGHAPLPTPTAEPPNGP